MTSTLETVADETARDALSPAVGDTLYQIDTKQVITCASLGPVVWRIYDSDAVAYTSTGENDLNYPSGLFTDTGATYYVSTQPAWHFDASILDGAAAANNPANGTAVAAWGDRSGNGQDTAQTTGSRQPAFHTKPSRPYGWVGNSRPFLRMDNDTMVFDSSYSVTGVGTLFTVAMRFSTLGRLFESYQFVSLAESVALGSAGTVKIYNLTTSGTYDTSTTPVMIAANRDSSNLVTGWINGGSAALGPTLRTSAFTITQFGRSSSDTMVWEQIYFAADLSLEDMNVVREYLSNKYAFLSTTEIE
jgi:hypothetical protein